MNESTVREAVEQALSGIPRLSIAQLPTPLHALGRLRTLLGPHCPRLLIKRDDLTGLALGGNKARKLEYLLADARRVGADTIITCGAAQSNHALQTAVACREHGFAVCCVLYGAQPTGERATGNLVLHALVDTPIRWVRMIEGEMRREQALRRGLAEAADTISAEGGRPYIVPTGGSTAMGALGYVRAVAELHEQIEVMGVGAPVAAYFASGSGGTHAGLVVGKRLLDAHENYVGVEIDPIPAGPDGVSPFRRFIEDLVHETAGVVGLPEQVWTDAVALDARFTGPAYGAETPEGREAGRLLFRSEGILLDPVYTAKAFAAMLSAIERRAYRQDDVLLFWHTGGAAGIFASH